MNNTKVFEPVAFTWISLGVSGLKKDGFRGAPGVDPYSFEEVQSCHMQMTCSKIASALSLFFLAFMAELPPACSPGKHNISLQR